MGLSPESGIPVEADVVATAEGKTEALNRPDAEAPPGSETGARMRRSSRNLGDPVFSMSGKGGRGDSQ